MRLIGTGGRAGEVHALSPWGVKEPWSPAVHVRVGVRSAIGAAAQLGLSGQSRGAWIAVPLGIA